MTRKHLVSLSCLLISIFFNLAVSQHVALFDSSESNFFPDLLRGKTFDVIVTMKISSTDLLKPFLHSTDSFCPTNSTSHSPAPTTNATTPSPGPGSGRPCPEGTIDTRATHIASFLQDKTTAIQSRVLQILQGSHYVYKTFWVSNQIFIRAADLKLVTQLYELEEVREELKMALDGGDTNSKYVIPLRRQTEWNLVKIEADKMWAKGVLGEGIIVGSIDTGVRYFHEALRDNYIGLDGWHDPVPLAGTNADNLPNDANGHGTHTMGIIVGRLGIGVAPLAKWMACRGCQANCLESNLIACGQFMMCPQSAQGNVVRCSHVPHVINNSWGRQYITEKQSKYFDAVIESWRAAGIIPVFAQGNSGPKCATAQAPGTNDGVIAVGATDNHDAISSINSMGPAVFSGKIKPDISAPGVDVTSASHLTDTGYGSRSGTSMACPHVAGAIALLLSATKSQGERVKYDQVLRALTKGADINVPSTRQSCGGVSPEKFPNNVYGSGRLNVNRAHSILMSITKPTQRVTELPKVPNRQQQSNDRNQCNFQPNFNVFGGLRIFGALADIVRCKLQFLSG